MPSAKTIRQMLVEEMRRNRGEHGFFDAHDRGLLQVMMSYPRSDALFLGEIAKRGNGPALLEMILALFSNSHRGLLISRVRQWAEKNNRRRGFLDVIDRWEKGLPSSPLQDLSEDAGFS